MRGLGSAKRVRFELKGLSRLTVELSGEPAEDPPQHYASLHSLHQTQPRLQAHDLPKGGGRYCPQRTAAKAGGVLTHGCCQVISQLKACGIVETIHISAAGFPIR